jgi:hypothetical protein
MNILPGAAAQPLHRDDGMYSEMGGLPDPHLPLTVNTVITLDEFTPVNGATRIVPGSKDECGQIDSQRGNETAVLAAKVHAVLAAKVHAACPAGSLIAWSGSTVSFACAYCWHMCVRANGYGIVQTSVVAWRRPERFGGAAACTELSLLNILGAPFLAHGRS